MDITTFVALIICNTNKINLKKPLSTGEIV